MTAYDKARMKKRFDWSGDKYSELIGKIIKENKAKIGDKVGESGKRRFETSLRDILPKGKRDKKIVLPDVSNIVRRSPTIIKAATQGELIMKTLRERMAGDVKRAMISEGINSKAGHINKNVARSVRKNLNETFDSYTKRDPKFKKPTNIEAIVVTETQSVANTVRHDYAKAVNESAEADGVKMTKTWIHNRPKKSHPRTNHIGMHGTEIDMDDKFILTDSTGVKVEIEGPYDSRLSAADVICCRCELLYRWRKVKS